MTEPLVLDLTPTAAAALLQEEIARADRALDDAGVEAALDGYVRALGLALQLGPAPTEQVLVAALQTARELAMRQDAAALSTLGPALVDVVDRVRAAGVLPATAIMAAWATVAADVGSLIGQVGLVLALPPGHRQGMIHNAQARARLLDEATDNLFQLSTWLAELDLAP